MCHGGKINNEKKKQEFEQLLKTLQEESMLEKENQKHEWGLKRFSRVGLWSDAILRATAVCSIDFWWRRSWRDLLKRWRWCSSISFFLIGKSLGEKNTKQTNNYPLRTDWPVGTTISVQYLRSLIWSQAIRNSYFHCSVYLVMFFTFKQLSQLSAVFLSVQ